MSRKPKEINDDEIRIITGYEPKRSIRKKRFLRLCLPVAVLISLVALGIILFPGNHHEDEMPEIQAEAKPAEIKADSDASGSAGAFTSARDTTINGRGLLILTPENARPRLVIGRESLNDHDIILATQAADVRGDNGQIAGTFVVDGELVSKGDAKAGFCSIINGDLTIGIADSTPMLEKCLTDGGYFFRQYPLVAGGQIVENKPKGKSIRKAIAEIGGTVSVAVSKEKLTFHDFSQLLIDAGARNAIYLVGSTSHGFYVDDNGQKFQIGSPPWKFVENVNYIVWE